MSSIILKDVTKSFKNCEIIKGINLVMEDGECTVLVGPSGCGKSTLLRLICGLEKMTSGEIYIGDMHVDNDVPPANRGLAMVFQSYALYPHMTVFENMSFALKVRKLKKDEIEKRVINAAEILKIDHLLQRKPKELSGGQRQRVAIGRAIVRNPYAFLFDEPLSNLDTGLRQKMRYEIAKLKEQLKTTMVYVTHDQAEAMTLADKIVVMRDGIIEQVGTPIDVYNNPVNTFVAKFIGSSEMNFLHVKYASISDKNVMFTTNFNTSLSCMRNDCKYVFSTDKVYTIGVRSESIEILNNEQHFAENSVTGKVVLIENFGGECFLHVEMSDTSHINVKAKNTNVLVGQIVTLGFSFNKCHIFDEHGNKI